MIEASFLLFEHLLIYMSVVFNILTVQLSIGASLFSSAVSLQIYDAWQITLEKNYTLGCTMAGGSSVLLLHSLIIAHSQPSAPGFKLCSGYCLDLFLGCPEFIFSAMLAFKQPTGSPLQVGIFILLCFFWIILFLIIRVDCL